LASGKPGAVPTRSDGTVWVAPTRAGELISYEQSRDQEESDGLDSQGTLLRLLWMDRRSHDVLRAVLRHPTGMNLFKEFVEPRSKRDMIGLTLWQQVQQCLRLSDVKERERQVMALHDAHCGVGMDSSVPPAEVLHFLDQRAEKTLTRLQEQWLMPFLERHGVELIRLVTEAPAGASGADDAFGALERLKGTWLEMLMQATENLPFALIVADMHEPGAKLVSVNAVFERLTGWAKGDALGQNCRFLQGEGTEQEALAQLVDGLRSGAKVLVELTNYRRDGSSFRNRLTTCPVHDSDGVYRYSIGVLADALVLSAPQREKYERLCRLLPRSFDSRLQPLPWASAAVPIEESVAPESSAMRPLESIAKQSRLSREVNISEPIPEMMDRQRRLRKMMWLEDVKASVQTLVGHAPSMASFREHL
jgi:PAS domain S-box-containing protein